MIAYAISLAAICLVQLSTAHAWQSRSYYHGFPVRRDGEDTESGQPGAKGIVSDSFACNFTKAFVTNAVETSCKAYVDRLETSATFTQSWERSESIDRFSNCTLHQIFVQFPHAPEEGVGEQLFLGPNSTDPGRYGPLPALESTSGTEVHAVEFVPIFQKATQSFYDQLASVMKCDPKYAPGLMYGNVSANSSANANQSAPWDAYTDESLGSDAKQAASKLYQSFDIAAQQYARCTFQKAADVSACAVDTTAKLHWLPSSLFIFSDAAACDAKTWTYVDIGLTLVIEAAFLTARKLSKAHAEGVSAFSWMLFLFNIAKGLGHPILEVLVIRRDADMSFVSNVLVAAMKLLQPTQAPLLAAIGGVLLSKGEAFQILMTDAVTTLAGALFVLLATAGQVIASPSATLASYIGAPGSGFALIPIGFLLAVGPWLLLYVLVGFGGLIFQLFFILALIEMCIVEDPSGICLGIALFGLAIFTVEFLFVALTPVWALWELGWNVWIKTNKRKAQSLEKDGGEKPVFPLARYFRRQMEKTWFRRLMMCIFALFLILSFASFVGKWMLTVNILNYAGDAYCTSHNKEGVFAGLGFRVVMALLALGLEYVGLA